MSSFTSYLLQIAEILKNRPAWSRDCRRHEVYTMLPTGNGGTIELLYTQVSFCYIVAFS